MRTEIAAIVEDVEAFHRLMDTLVAIRKERGISRTEVSKRMGSMRVLAIESENSDPHVGELQAYARAIGCRVYFEIDEEPDSEI